MPLTVKRTVQALSELKHFGDVSVNVQHKRLGLTPAEVVELVKHGLAAVHEPKKGPAVLHITALGGKFLQEKLAAVTSSSEGVEPGSANHIDEVASSRKSK